LTEINQILASVNQFELNRYWPRDCGYFASGRRFATCTIPIDSHQLLSLRPSPMSFPSYIPSEHDPLGSWRAAVRARFGLEIRPVLCAKAQLLLQGGSRDRRIRRHVGDLVVFDLAVSGEPRDARWASPPTLLSPPPRRRRPEASPSPPLASEDITHAVAALRARGAALHRRPEPVPWVLGNAVKWKRYRPGGVRCAFALAIRLAAPQ
jgi:hypothetical protein